MKPDDLPFEQKCNETGIEGVEKITQLPGLIETPVIAERVKDLIEEGAGLHVVHKKENTFKVQRSAVPESQNEKLDTHAEKCGQHSRSAVGSSETYFHGFTSLGWIDASIRRT